MNLGPWLRGFVVGLSIAAPVGPIGVLCIRRTLAEGRLVGFVSGLGAATADALYGSVAGFGLTWVSDVLVRQQTWLRLAGGAFLCYLGLRTILAAPKKPAPSMRASGVLGAYGSTFLLTVTNPMTILSFVAIFAGLGLGMGAGDYASAGMLVSGVFMGSALWWLILSGGASLFRGRLKPQGLRWLNGVSGVIITGFGLYALLGLAV